MLHDEVQVPVQLSDGLAHGGFELEVEQIVGQMGPHEKFRGEIADDANVFVSVPVLRSEPSGENAIAHGIGDGGEEFFVAGGVLGGSHDEEEIVEDGPLQGFHADGSTVILKDWGCRYRRGLNGFRGLHGTPRSLWMRIARLGAGISSRLSFRW